MNKNKWLYDFLKIFVNFIFFVVFAILQVYVLFIFGFIEWLELDLTQFYSKLMFTMIIFLLIYYISDVINIAWHELGHLIFGSRAELSFKSFSVLKLTIIKENNKLMLKRYSMFPGTKGYCYMEYDEDKEYDKNKIILYYMGGIIFNFILSIIFLIILLLSKNIYLDIISMIFICTSIYYALYNLIPSTQKSGVATDMLQVIYYLNDPKYTQVFGRCIKIQNMVREGHALKDLDASLFYLPEFFNNRSDILMAQFYIDYLSDKGQYNKAIESIKYALENSKDIISKADTSLLKVQLLSCLFYGKYDINEIKKYWNNDDTKYLEVMSKVAPQFIGFSYLYFILIEKNKEKTKKCLNNFTRIKKYYPDNKNIKEIENLINEVDKRNE